MDSIQIENLNFSYGEKQILKNINITLHKGEFVCLCGANGSGKTTLLKEIEKLANKNTTNSKNTNLKNAAFLKQSEFCAWNSTVFNFILTGRFMWTNGHYSKEDFAIVEESAQILGIANLLERSVYSLSGGEMQKTRIARILAQKTDFLLLDEPCANLDFTVETELLSFLKKFSKDENKGILISIHDLNSASRFADRIELLLPLEKNANGGLISGSAEEIFHPEIMEKAFGSGIKIFSHPIYKCPQITM